MSSCRCGCGLDAGAVEFRPGHDQKLRLEAIRTLRDSQLADRQALLWQIAEDLKLPTVFRCEAIVGLQPDAYDSTERLIAMAGGNDQALATESLRSLRGAPIAASQREQLASLKSKSAVVADLVNKVLAPQADANLPQPNELDRWLTLLEGPADAAAGERVFFHSKSASCSRCHQVDGRGAQVGPDLTVTGRTLERRRLVESILSPSKEIAPQFVVWSIQLTDGRSLAGMLLGINADDSERYADPTGKVFSLKPITIESRKPLTNSLMPENLQKQMTVQEFRDLLAFLQHGGE
jgi:putative heme-binding domain-containing protein